MQDALRRGEGFPAAETFRELGHALDGEIRLNEEGGTLITVARSLCAGAFLASRAEVWLSWDDDVFAPRLTLRHLYLATRASRGLVGLPGIMRSGRAPNFAHIFPRWDTGRIRETEGGKLYPVSHVAFSCVGIHRDVVQRLVGTAPWVKHHSGAMYPALFQEGVRGHEWIGEDVGFCLRMHEHPDLACAVLLEAPFTHAGDECLLGEDGELRAKRATIDRLTEAAEP